MLENVADGVALLCLVIVTAQMLPMGRRNFTRPFLVMASLFLIVVATGVVRGIETRNEGLFYPAIRIVALVSMSATLEWAARKGGR